MKLLIVIDMQNDFIDGALGTAEAVKIVPTAARIIGEYHRAGDAVIFTRDTHTANYLNTREGVNLPVEHCIKGTHGWEISDALDVADSAVIDKPSFGSLELSTYVGEHFGDAETIEIIGLCTDICVISNALILKAALPECDICVNAAACAGVTPESHANALSAMRMCQIRITGE